MSVSEHSVRFRPLAYDDLDLLLAWRSNPRMFEHLRDQDGPLEWSNHVQWFLERPEDRHDFMIEYRGRRIGVVSVDGDDHVGVLVGEESSWGLGISTIALQWLCDRFSNERELFAEIQAENERSINLFEKCGFEVYDCEDEWITYRLE